MPLRFKVHYTPTEARALLPDVRGWLDCIENLSENLREIDEEIDKLQTGGLDLGGEWVEARVAVFAEMSLTLREFSSRQIQIKDLERGLIDFPALLDGREVLLCWEKSEDDIVWWHDLESGYADRQPLF